MVLKVRSLLGGWDAGQVWMRHMHNLSKSEGHIEVHNRLRAAMV